MNTLSRLRSWALLVPVTVMLAAACTSPPSGEEVTNVLATVAGGLTLVTVILTALFGGPSDSALRVCFIVFCTP